MLLYPRENKQLTESEVINMLTALDFLAMAFVGLSALSLLAVCLMFLVRKPVARKVCFYIVVILCIYMAYVGLYISSGFFLGQTIVAVIVGLTGIATVVLERLSNNDNKKFLIARILSAIALVIGMFNAFLW